MANMTIREFFEMHDIHPGVVITLAEYIKVIEEGEKTFGKEAGSILMDCFVPEGEAVDPGFEDSLSHYCFDCDSITWKAIAAPYIV